MLNLLQQFSLGQIAIYTVVLLLALKEGLTLFDYFCERARKHYSEETQEQTEQEIMQAEVDSLHEEIRKVQEDSNQKEAALDAAIGDIKQLLSSQQVTLNLLVESDKDDIKSWIVQQYHYFVEEKGWIDDFSLDVIERRFEHYEQEGGNHYIHTLMDEIRSLPKHPPQ